MLNKLITFLKDSGYPVRLRGYLMDADIENTPIILYEETDSKDCMCYSNRTTGILWTYTIHIITKSPSENIKIAQQLKKDSIFTPFILHGLGSGYSIQGTDYYGRQIKMQAIERI